MRVSIAAIAVAIAVATWPIAGHAYFGPGAGITMLSAVWGVVLAIGFALFAILAWPIRAMLRRGRKPAAPANPLPAQPATTIAKPDSRA